MCLKERHEFLRKLNAAFDAADIEFLSVHVADDVTWSIVGNRKIYGKTGFIKFIQAEQGFLETVKTIERIISDGPDLSVTGIVHSIHTEKKAMWAYHDVYRFTKKANGKILELTSFIMKL